MYTAGFNEYGHVLAIAFLDGFYREHRAKVNHLNYLYRMAELRYKRVEGKFLVSQLADETVLMDTVSGDYMGLNPVGTAIWELMQEPQTISTLVTTLTGRYEVTEEQCRLEVEPFLQELDKRKMLAIE